MAKTMPINIPIPSESSIASYSWTEISTGLGYRTFYLARTYDGTADDLSLIENPIFAPSNGNIRVNPADVGSSDDEDLLITFNKPLTIAAGRVYLILAMGSFSNSGTTINGTVTVTLEKISGATTTTIGSAISSNISESVSATGTKFKWYSRQFIWDIEQTTFKAGDILNLNIALTISTGSNNSIEVIFDPSNKSFSDSFYNTPIFVDSKILIPQRIDI